MQFSDSPEEVQWRSEVRQFLETEYPGGAEEGIAEGGLFDRGERMKEWRRRVVARGWVAPAWPKEYGGAGLGVKEQFIMNEEFAEFGAPQVGGFGVMMFGPTLIVHGTEAQKKEHLAGILNGETLWCQGWSEPGAFISTMR